MAEKIGYQSGIDATVNRLIKLDPEGKAAYEKIRRTLKLLAADYDARQTSDPPPPPPPPPPAYKKVAPKTVNTEGASDQRFSMRSGGSLRPGVTIRPDGFYTDESGAVYATNGDGLEESSVRNKDIIPGLVGAKSMDGRSADECPTVGDPTKNTGSWAI